MRRLFQLLRVLTSTFNDLFTTLLALLHSYLQSVILTILSTGPIPQHIGLIIDGHRRFAKSKGTSINQGNLAGYHKLHKAAQLCFQLGIKAVTIYAVSINNLQRPPDQLADLINLILDKMNHACEPGQLVDQFNVRMNIIGDIALLDPHAQETIQRVMNATRHNTGVILNFCLPYLGREDIRQAVVKVCKEVNEGELDAASITPALFTQYLMTAESPPLDLVIRSAGDKRISDFLPFQAASTACPIYFIGETWPQVTATRLLGLLINWQICR